MQTKELSQSITVQELLPQHVVDNNPEFVVFLEKYYDWMEQEGNVNNVMHTFGMTYQDSFVESMYQLYLDEYATKYPFSHALRKDLFIKIIREILATKGSGDAVKLFFSSVLNDRAEVRFPVGRSKTPSDYSLYEIKTHIVTSDANLETKLSNLELLVGNFVYGNRGAIGFVENVEHYEFVDYTIVKITLSRVLERIPFVDGEIVTATIITSPSNTELLVEFVVGGIISGYEIINPGSGYKVGEYIFVSTGNQYELCRANISSVDANGGITGIKITNTGYGYSVGAKGQVLNSLGTGAEILFVNSSYNVFDTRRNTTQIAYIESDNIATGKDNLGNYFASGYVEEGYVNSGAGSRNPNDYGLSTVVLVDSKPQGAGKKFYLEYHITKDPITNNFPHGKFVNGPRYVVGLTSPDLPLNFSEMVGGSYDNEIGIFPGCFSQDSTGIGACLVNTNYAYYQKICVAVDMTDPSGSKVYFGGVVPGNTTVWYSPTGQTLTPTFQIQDALVEGALVEGTLAPCVSSRLTPFQRIEIVTSSNKFSGTIPEGYVPWDETSSSTFKIVDESTLTTTDLYTYTIRSGLSSVFWSKLYKSLVHPAGTKYIAEFYSAIEPSIGNSMEMKVAAFYPLIQDNAFAMYDIEARKDYVLNAPTDLYGLVGTNSFPPETGRTILDLPVNIFDQDIIQNYSGGEVSVVISST
jgi:hypothetical protein